MDRRDFLVRSAALGASCGTIASYADDRPARAKGTASVYDPAYLKHSLGAGHPESPQRLKDIMTQLNQGGVMKDMVSIKPTIDPKAAIALVHPAKHVQLAAKQAKDNAICLLAVSGALTAVDEVCKGRARNAFCALRPPGHHAEDKGYFGFCFYNNVAIAARYAQTVHKLKRILIVDWDFHHGNGTEWAFYDDPSVLFFSTHHLASFPGTGSAKRTGQGKGVGYNMNAPLQRGATDKDILSVFEKKLLPKANAFKPELILISAGFDSRKDDLLGNFKITDDGFKRLTEMMADLARTHAGSKVVSVLEGGYNTKGLAKATEAHCKALVSAK